MPTSGIRMSEGRRRSWAGRARCDTAGACGWLHNRSEEMPAYPYHNYLAQTLPIPYASLADPFLGPYQNLPHSLHRKILNLPGEIL